MMAESGEARRLRARLAAVGDRLEALAAAGVGGTHRMVAQVYSAGAIPTAVGKFYACHPTVVAGTEAEGSTPSFAVDTSRTIYVDVLGTKVPVAGDYLVCRRVDHRWVAWRGIAGVVTPPSDICNFTTAFTAPTCTLTLGGGTYTLLRYVSGGHVTYQPDITINGGNATFSTPNFVGIVSLVPQCPFVTGNADFTVTLQCGPAPFNHVAAAITFWPLSCSGVRGFAKANTLGGTDGPVLTLTSYTDSPLNAIYSISALSAAGQALPAGWTGNATFTP